MAFAAANLFRATELGYGKTLWHYCSTDSATDVDTEGYFDVEFGLLRLGDVIIVQTYGSFANGQPVGAPSSTGTMIVTDLGPVDVTNAISLQGSDTD